MKTCFYYLLIEPVRGGFHDTADAEPAFSIEIAAKDRDCQLALFVDENGLPAYARLTIPKIVDELIPEDVLPMIQEVKEHLLSALRFGYHQEVNYFPRPIWTFVEEGNAQKVGVAIKFHGDVPFDPERTRQMFAAGFPYRQEVRLLVDAADGRIPLQYRYLSAYKVIELEFKSKGRWKKTELDNFLLPFADRARSLGVSKSLSRYLHDLRDKCAHIRTGKDAFGVTHLDNKQAAEVEKCLPLLGDIAIAVINRRGGKSFSLHHGPKSLPPPEASAERSD